VPITALEYTWIATCRCGRIFSELCVKMLCGSASATPDSSFFSSCHITDAGGRTHPLQIGLWQQRARWSPSLSHEEITVCSQCGSAAYLP